MKSNSQQPTANSQQPTANSQQPTAMKGIGQVSRNIILSLAKHHDNGREDIDSEALNMTTYNRTRMINLGVIELGNVCVGSGWRIRLTDTGKKLLPE